jgi:hypothetical protein
MRTVGFNSAQERETAKSMIASLRAKNPSADYDRIAKAFEANKMPRPSKRLVAEAISTIGRYEPQWKIGGRRVHFYLPSPLAAIVKHKATVDAISVELMSIRYINEGYKRLQLRGADSLLVSAINNHCKLSCDLNQIEISQLDAAACFLGSCSRAFFSSCGVKLNKEHRHQTLTRLGFSARLEDHITQSAEMLSNSSALSQRAIYSALLISGMTPMAYVSDSEFFSKSWGGGLNRPGQGLPAQFTFTQRLLTQSC